MERKSYSHIQLTKITNSTKCENICDIIYQKAYDTYLFNILNDNNNKLGKNMFPIKLERSVNIVK